MVKSHVELVKAYNPSANCVLRPHGKTYYQILDETLPESYKVLGQGKTKQAAWKSAYRNVYDHR
jgi:hypothetical protein